MTQRLVEVPGIGQVLLAKRKGTRHLRLSITSDGRVRVGIPAWTPYSVAISFAKSRAEWINKHLDDQRLPILSDGDRIGKAHRLHFYRRTDDGRPIRTRIEGGSIEVYSDLAFDSPEVQNRARSACERALKNQSEKLLPGRLAELARLNDYEYETVRIKKLTSRWGSCSNAQTISLSYYLIQLPWPLIDYVLVHELVHTKKLHHGKEFWNALEQALPNARLARKSIKAYKPQVLPLPGD